jgi:hypothetical protein
VEFSLERADFQSVQFDDQEHIRFLTFDLSQVSFVNTDISRVRFGESVKWGLASKRTHHYFNWRYGDNDKFKILEEREIGNSLAKDGRAENVILGSVLAVYRNLIYRNLRENYEYRMRYDEAGEFFIREMEMERNYKQVNENGRFLIRRNNWIVRNLSLTGLYYHLSRYGQSFSRPALFGVGIVLFSTLLWLTHPNPAAPDFSIINATFPAMNDSSNFQIAFERSLTNFLPNLSFGTETGAGLLDFAFKIVGGAVTFGLIIIALRRKFERKFRH